MFIILVTLADTLVLESAQAGQDVDRRDYALAVQLAGQDYLALGDVVVNKQLLFHVS